MNTAILLKETEKAIFVTFGADVYEKCVTIKTWLPKSQVEIEKKEGEKIYFELKNNWLLGAKIMDYAKYLDSKGYNMPSELRTYLGVGHNEDIEYCYA